MPGALLMLGVLLGLAASALALAACLRLSSLAQTGLAAYVIAWTELVVSALALSTVHLLNRPGIVMATSACLAVGLGAWHAQGRPRPPALSDRLYWLTTVLRDPLLLVPFGLVTASYLYFAVLGLGTPQNDADALVYHLTRAALWRQHGSIGWTDVAFEPRIDANPIVAEIGQATTMIAAGSERFVWIGQWSAVVALALGTFAVARRLSLPAREALFGALLVPLLPIVLVQSFTAYNDLVVASFVLAAGVFALGDRRADLVPFGLAVGLAVGTKLTAPLVLPLVALLVLAGRPPRSWPAVAVAGAVGAVVGAGWYAVNLAQTGKLDGGLAEAGGQTSVITAAVSLFHLQSQILDALELPGARGSALLLYPIAGIVLAASLLAHRRRGITSVLAGTLVALTPLAVIGVGHLLERLFVRGWTARHEDGFARQIGRWEPSRWADGLATSFGPLLIPLVIGTLIVSVVAWRRYMLPRLAVAVAAAPLLGIVIVAVVLPEDPWRSRFLVAAVAMDAALWGIMLRARWLAWSVTTALTVTLALVLVNADGKPSGIPLLRSDPPKSVWRLDRTEAQTLLRVLPFTKPENATLRWVAEHVAEGQGIALALGYNDLVYPYFGRTLDRRLALVDEQEAAPADVGWMVSAPGRTPTACPESWRTAHVAGAGGGTAWIVWERTAPDTCALKTPLLVR